MAETRWPHLILQLSQAEERALERALVFAAANMTGDRETVFHVEEILRSMSE